jgi:hypothetical protein
MNIVDSSGWIEYFTDGKNADFFATPFRDVDNLIVPTICIFVFVNRKTDHFNHEKPSTWAG